MSRAKGATLPPERAELVAQIAARQGVSMAAERWLRLVGLAADEDPELGFIGVLALKDVVQVCEEHRWRLLVRPAGCGLRLRPR